MTEVRPRHPRREATGLVPPGTEARVLEPSPPANDDPDWVADDPTDPDGASAVVTPIPREGTTWAELAATDTDVATYAVEHWLDGTRRVDPLPDAYAETRDSLHQIAFFALAPARYAATGKLGLRYTHRGFGTPFFRGPTGEDEQVRVERGLLVHQVGETVRSTSVSTLEDATRFLGLEYREQWFDSFHDPLVSVGSSTRLQVDVGAAGAVDGWFGFATHVLERLRRVEAESVSRVQLWPEHFDVAMEAGSAAAGQRASYGASPGDASHPEPYLYVTPWAEIDDSDSYWNATGFVGAVLGHAELRAAEDPYATALDFYTTGLSALVR